MSRFPRHLLPLVLLLAVPLTGCLFRSRKVERRLSTAVLRQATLQELTERINSEAAKIRTLDATVDIAATTGGAKKGKITEYQDVRGYLLVREPDMLRMIGLFPVLRNKAFDMVSAGNEFRLSIPSRNRFIVGRNDVPPAPGAGSLESLRPHIIFDALLLHQLHPQNEIAILEGGTEEVVDPKTRKLAEQAVYIVTVIARGDQGWRLSRKIIFSRTDLLPHRQLIFDRQGNLATDARYDNFQDFGGVSFPGIG